MSRKVSNSITFKLMRSTRELTFLVIQSAFILLQTELLSVGVEMSLHTPPLPSTHL
jgi:hypothetical protein